jgi:D-glycero-D-manno-heptose 1,7-bisphosphate phosphatase
LLALQRDDPKRSVLGLYREKGRFGLDGFALQPDGALRASTDGQASWLFMGMALLAAQDIAEVLAYLFNETDRIRSPAQFLGCPLPDPEWVPDPATGRTLFLDRDGVINRRIMEDYVRRPEDFHFLPGVPEALARLRPGFRHMVVVTNQQGIGKGLMREADLTGVHQKMVRELEAHGVHLDGIYHCPGLASEGPVCRKPLPGMALMALRDHPDIDFQQSVMVGDTESDMRFGARLGMHTVLIGEGSELAAECALDLPTWADRWLCEGH